MPKFSVDNMLKCKLNKITSFVRFEIFFKKRQHFGSQSDDPKGTIIDIQNFSMNKKSICMKNKSNIEFEDEMKNRIKTHSDPPN